MSSAREAGSNLFRREYDLDAPDLSRPPIVNLSNMLLADALKSGARQIQLIMRDAEHGNVEYEIASEWRVVGQIPREAIGALINRLKVMAALDISRVPVQEGELHVRVKGESLIFRIRTEVTGAAYEHVRISGLPATAA